MKKQAATAKGAGNSSCNGFEELVAIQLNLKFWPGQAKLKPADLGLKEDEVPEIYYLGNKNAKTAATRFRGENTAIRKTLSPNSARSARETITCW
jgi:hypothetical protein